MADQQDDFTPAQVTTGIDLEVELPDPFEPGEFTENFTPASFTPDYNSVSIPGEAGRAAVDSGGADAATSTYDQTIKSLQERNRAWLRGEISGDVADQLRAQAALGARSGGAGADSQAGRNLQARDFGLTSMDIQQRGMQQEFGIAEAQRGLAALHEQRFQFMQNLAEQQHQFSSSFGLSQAQMEQQSNQFAAGLGMDAQRMEEQSRQFAAGMGMDAQRMGEQSRQFGASLAADMYRSQLAGQELRLKQEAFNAEQNMRIVDLITNMTMAMTGQQVQAALGDVDDSGMTKTFNNLQQMLERLLQGNTAR